jgi:hypothetical protein
MIYRAGTAIAALPFFLRLTGAAADWDGAPWSFLRSAFSRRLAGQRAKRRGRDRPARQAAWPGLASAAASTAWRERASAWTCSFHRKPRPSRWKRKGGRLAVTSAHRRCVGDRRSPHLRAHIMPDGSLHLTGVDLRLTLQNPQVSRDPALLRRPWRQGADLRSSGFAETPNA